MRPVPENAQWIVEALNAPAQIKTAEPEQCPPVSLPSSVESPDTKRDQERAQIGAPSLGSTLRSGLKALAFALYRPIRPIVRSVMWRSRSFFSQPIIEEVGSSRGQVIEAMEFSNARLADEIRAIVPRLERMEHQQAKELMILKADVRALASVPHMLMELCADSSVLRRELTEISMRESRTPPADRSA